MTHELITKDEFQTVMVDITEEKKNKIIALLLDYCIKHECFSAETLHQMDDPLIDAPRVLGEIIDEGLQFDVTYNDE